jgi:hypothetical protein
MLTIRNEARDVHVSAAAFEVLYGDGWRLSIWPDGENWMRRVWEKSWPPGQVPNPTTRVTTEDGRLVWEEH